MQTSLIIGIGIFVLIDHCFLLLMIWRLMALKPRNNSKEGQAILAETEDINANAGTVKYHLRQAELLQQAANEHMREAAERADLMQVKANHAKKAIG